MNLIPEWRKAWKLSSLQIAIRDAIINAAALGWTAFDGHVRPVLWASVNMFLGVAVAVARVIPQPKVTGTE
ncbi:MAG TPA: hypothetical protein DHV63_13105 [Pseudomonas sp.]|nr:hypothetical protein [Pseudomonas sp.]